MTKIIQIIRHCNLQRKIGAIGRGCFFGKYHCIEGKGLFIGSNCIIGDGAWIKASIATGNLDSQLRINDGCNIGRFNEIYATKRIILEKDVLTAERVYISDNLHGYEDPNIPIMKQSLIQKRTVTIGEGSWIGVGVAIIGANIGKHCIIGANAVVTHDIPDYSVAVGIPAKIIKRYDTNLQEWITL